MDGVINVSSTAGSGQSFHQSAFQDARKGQVSANCCRTMTVTLHTELLLCATDLSTGYKAGQTPLVLAVLRLGITSQWCSVHWGSLNRCYHCRCPSGSFHRMCAMTWGMHLDGSNLPFGCRLIPGKVYLQWLPPAIVVKLHILLDAGHKLAWLTSCHFLHRHRHHRRRNLL